MWKLLTPPAYKAEQTGPEADARYKKLRWQVFLGIFIGYAGFYIVRKNFSMAIPMLANFGFEKGELGIVLSMNAIAYGFSKFIMASISDRSNARTFSIKERGTWMSFWNCAHNVGGALVGPMAVYGALWFGSWFYGADEQRYFLIGTYAFPAAVAILIALMAYSMIRDTPQSCGLPSIEKWSGSASKNYSEKAEEVLSTKEIFKIVLTNKFLWYIAFANAFVYMVRYGCLDWAPTILTERGIDIKSAGWAYFAYEMAAIPGTIICGWLSDKVFQGRRALPTILFMILVAIAIVVYWQNIDNVNVVIGCLIAIGFLIYGPVMLIGVQALDLAPKNAAGTAAGLTGFMGYVLGTALLANIVIGYVAEAAGWNWTFILLIIACLFSILFMGLTYREEQYLAKKAQEEK